MDRSNEISLMISAKGFNYSHNRSLATHANYSPSMNTSDGLDLFSENVSLTSTLSNDPPSNISNVTITDLDTRFPKISFSPAIDPEDDPLEYRISIFDLEESGGTFNWDHLIEDYWIFNFTYAVQSPLQEGCLYGCRIEVVDQYGPYGIIWQVNFTIDLPPSNISGIRAWDIPGTEGSVFLNWDWPENIDNISGFEVHCWNEDPLATNTPEIIIENISVEYYFRFGTNPFYVLQDMTVGKKIWLSVCAYDENGNKGPMGIILSGFPLDQRPPNFMMPPKLELIEVPLSCNVIWNNLDENDTAGFYVYRVEDSPPDSFNDIAPLVVITEVQTFNMMWVDINISYNRTYFYAVFPFDSSGNVDFDHPMWQELSTTWESIPVNDKDLDLEPIPDLSEKKASRIDGIVLFIVVFIFLLLFLWLLTIKPSRINEGREGEND